MSEPRATPFLSHFAPLRDPRQASKVLYPLAEILLLLLCATICGADDFVEIELWGEEHLAFLRRFLPFVRGIPSHDMSIGTQTEPPIGIQKGPLSLRLG
jgi:hypothetical protein